MLKLKRNKKKHKRGKEAELFTPEELAKYKQQIAEKKNSQQPTVEEGIPPSTAETAYKSSHEEVNEVAGSSKESEEASDEWQRFKELTAGVDDILKKSQGDLGRIKETSFFQRTASPHNKESRKKPERPAPPIPTAQEQTWVGFEEGGTTAAKSEKPVEQEQVETAAKEDEELSVEQEHFAEESEEDIPVDDGLFDTSYVDVVTSGEIKLVYVPESPTEEEAVEGDDPFDTSIVDTVIAPTTIVTKDGKTKKLVSLGCAVDVLTGRLDKAIPIPIPEISNVKKRRVIPQDLLLQDENSLQLQQEPVSTDEFKTDFISETLLDGDPVIETIDDLLAPVLNTTAPISVSETENTDNTVSSEQKLKYDLKELGDPLEENSPVHEIKTISNAAIFESLDDTNIDKDISKDEIVQNFDAFDDDDFDPRAGEPNEKINPDLLSNTHTDVYGLVHNPIEPEVDLVHTDNEFDPFDTSAVDALVPSKAELKLLEQELLAQQSEEKKQSSVNIISTFIPETTQKKISVAAPDVLEVEFTAEVPDRPLTPQLSTILSTEDTIPDDPFDTSFASNIHPGKTELKILESELITSTIPSDNFQRNFETIPSEVFCEAQQPRQVEHLDLLATTEEEFAPHKPLTPGQETTTTRFPEADPFDTSSVNPVLLPGRTELRLLESELEKLPQSPPAPKIPPLLTRRLTDPEFEPRSSDPAQVNDFLDTTESCDAPHQPLSPQLQDETADIDPFDTSFAADLQPGRAELKLLEAELIGK